MWIDVNYYCDECSRPGDVGFLVEAFASGRTTYYMSVEPLRTNRSHEPRLHGWCGETSNVSRTARGVWRVTKTNAAETRILISQVTGTALATFLNEVGYPELLDVEAAQ